MKCRSEPRRCRTSFRNSSIFGHGAAASSPPARPQAASRFELRQHAGVGDEFLQRLLVGGDRHRRRRDRSPCACTAASSAWSSICMPKSRPICSWLGTWWVWSVWISLAMALVITMTSQMALRPWPSAVLHQHLRDHREQALREEALGLLALLDGQRVDDAVDGLDRAGGVQRAEHQVSGLRRGHRHARSSRHRAFRRPGSRPDPRAWPRARPSAKLGRWVPSSRWITWQVLLRWTNSIGILEADDVESLAWC